MIFGVAFSPLIIEVSIDYSTILVNSVGARSLKLFENEISDSSRDCISRLMVSNSFGRTSGLLTITVLIVDCCLANILSLTLLSAES